MNMQNTERVQKEIAFQSQWGEVRNTCELPVNDPELQHIYHLVKPYTRTLPQFFPATQRTITAIAKQLVEIR